MPIPRRRIIRPVATPPPVSYRVTRLRTKLEREQRLLAGWMVRLKRSFNGFDKYQRRVARLEREIAHWSNRMPPVIEVLISPTGETKLETRGFTGPACQQATKALEAALGLKQSETLTAEYHQPAQQQAGVNAQSDR